MPNPLSMSLLRQTLGALGTSLLIAPAMASALQLVDPYDAYGTAVVGMGGTVRTGNLVGYWGPGKVSDYELPVSSFVHGGRVNPGGWMEQLDTLAPQAAGSTYGRAYVDTTRALMGAELQRPITLGSSDSDSNASVRLLTRQLPTALSLSVEQGRYAHYSLRSGIAIYDQSPGALQGNQQQLLGLVIMADVDGSASWTASRWSWDGSTPTTESLGDGYEAFDYATLGAIVAAAVNGRSDDYFFEAFLNLSSYGYCESGDYVCESASSSAKLAAEISFADQGGSTVPEPASWALAAAALAAGLRARRRRG